MKQFKAKALRKSIKTIQRKFHYEISPLEHLQLEEISRKLKKSKAITRKKGCLHSFNLKKWIEFIPNIVAKMF
jgi:hypothetical protein